MLSADVYYHVLTKLTLMVMYVMICNHKKQYNIIITRVMHVNHRGGEPSLTVQEAWYAQ